MTEVYFAYFSSRRKVGYKIKKEQETAPLMKNINFYQTND